jgi:hypothetical protein
MYAYRRFLVRLATGDRYTDAGPNPAQTYRAKHSTQNMSCPSDAYLNRIPVYAGMTSGTGAIRSSDTSNRHQNSPNRALRSVNVACTKSFLRIHIFDVSGNFACTSTAVRFAAFTLPHRRLYASLMLRALTSSISTANIGESSPCS